MIQPTVSFVGLCEFVRVRCDLDTSQTRWHAELLLLMSGLLREIASDESCLCSDEIVVFGEGSVFSLLLPGLVLVTVSLSVDTPFRIGYHLPLSSLFHSQRPLSLYIIHVSLSLCLCLSVCRSERETHWPLSQRERDRELSQRERELENFILQGL